MSVDADVFVARAIGCAEEQGVVVAAVAENRDGTGRAVLFMSPVPGDDHTEVAVSNEHGATTYGGVEQVAVAGATLRINFSAAAAGVLGFATDLDISLDVKDEQRDELCDALRDIWNRCSRTPRLVLVSDCGRGVAKDRREAT